MRRRPGRSPSGTAIPARCTFGGARRPLATARAVLFSQLVDDPSSRPELFPTEEAQSQERQRLFRIIEELVKWENTTNETVLESAREEIRRSWRRTCEDNQDHPSAADLFDPDRLPAFHTPSPGAVLYPLRPSGWDWKPTPATSTRGGAHQQGHDRDSTPVPRPAAG